MHSNNRKVEERKVGFGKDKADGVDEVSKTPDSSHSRLEEDIDVRTMKVIEQVEELLKKSSSLSTNVNTKKGFRF